MTVTVKPIVNRCTNCELPYFCYDTDDDGLCGECHWDKKRYWKHENRQNKAG